MEGAVAINSVNKAISILNCFTSDAPVQGVTDISRMTGFTPSTVSRLLSTLESRGVVQKAGGQGKYQLGYQMYLWGLISKDSSNLASIAKPIMQALRDKSGETVALYVLAGNKRTCLARFASKHNIGMVGSLGGEYPLHAGASGRVLMAYVPEKKRKKIIEQAPLKKFTANTVTDPVQLEKKLAEIRKNGYAVSREEREPGGYSIVAPVRNAEGSVIASLCIGGPVFRLSEEQERQYIKSVLEASREISAKMGYRGDKE
jgi:DNA-binding IclR family transcriptional regulator